MGPRPAESVSVGARRSVVPIQLNRICVIGIYYKVFYEDANIFIEFLGLVPVKNGKSPYKANIDKEKDTSICLGDIELYLPSINLT